MKRLRKEHYFATILLVLFVILTLYVTSGKVDSMDERVFMSIIASKNKVLSTFFWIITNIGSTVGVIILLLITAIIFMKKNKLSDYKYLFFNVLSGVLLMEVLKNIIRRVRPTWKWISQSGFSFPSGHTITATLFYGTLLLLVFKRVHGKIKVPLIIFLLLMMFLIGLSRVYFGVHYLSDVLASYILGGIILLISNTFMNKEFYSNDKNKN